MAGGFGAQNIATVNQAASKAGIPFWVLWGVFGAESTWGKGGSNWFGLTAVPRTGSFAGDAKASANTLAGLYVRNGRNWDAALRQYSGGSYGEAHVKSLVKQSEPTPKEKKQAAEQTLVDPLTGQPSVNIPQKVKKAATGWVGELLEGLGPLVANAALSGVLLLAGAVLVIYGIMVAVRPRESALSIPLPR